MKTVEIILKTYLKKLLCGPWVRFSNSSSWFSTTGCVGYGVFCFLEPCHLFRQETTSILKMLTLITTIFYTTN